MRGTVERGFRRGGHGCIEASVPVYDILKLSCARMQGSKLVTRPTALAARTGLTVLIVASLAASTAGADRWAARAHRSGWGERTSPLTFFGPRRWYAPPLPLAELPSVDAVIISHDHYDHLDMPTVRALASRGVRWIVPL